jgi:hypothetical protein
MGLMQGRKGGKIPEAFKDPFVHPDRFAVMGSPVNHPVAHRRYLKFFEVFTGPLDQEGEEKPVVHVWMVFPPFCSHHLPVPCFGRKVRIDANSFDLPMATGFEVSVFADFVQGKLDARRATVDNGKTLLHNRISFWVRVRSMELLLPTLISS